VASDFWDELMRRRRRRRPFLSHFFEDIEEMIREMEEEVRMLMEMAPRELVRERQTKDGVVREVGPIVYGYSITIGPDGKPVVREFGNIRPGAFTGRTQLQLKPEREPLVDVIEEEKQVRVIAELPGVNKEDIELRADDNTLTIKVDTERRKYYKEVELPAQVNPNSAKASYNNGVLEVTLAKKEEEKKGQRIKVE